MLAQRHARGRNGLPLGRRSCDGARATSSVSTVATLETYVAQLKPRCGSLALSVMWYVLTVSQVGAT
eukprot:scaffold26269_cov53-Phaeocystis_antarctica.AAC.2